jgi:hypothetical protein
MEPFKMLTFIEGYQKGIIPTGSGKAKSQGRPLMLPGLKTGVFPLCPPRSREIKIGDDGYTSPISSRSACN